MQQSANQQRLTSLYLIDIFDLYIFFFILINKSVFQARSSGDKIFPEYTTNFPRDLPFRKAFRRNIHRSARLYPSSATAAAKFRKSVFSHAKPTYRATGLQKASPPSPKVRDERASTARGRFLHLGMLNRGCVAGTFLRGRNLSRIIMYYVDTFNYSQTQTKRHTHARTRSTRLRFFTQIS